MRGSVLCAVVIAAIPLAAAPDFAPLEKYAREQLTATGTPGIAIAVVVEGKIAYLKGIGTANIETGAGVTPDLLFRLGSTSKMFTAAALAVAADQGKLDLNAPVGKYVSGLAPKIAATTCHQLLSHTAGLRDLGPVYGRYDDDQLGKRVRALKDSDQIAEPGAVFSYSSPGYWLAGVVLEAVTGKSFADAVYELVLKPAGMTRSTFRPLLAMTYPFAMGHAPGADGKPVVQRPFADDSSTWPGGSLFSSAEELARFATAFMNGERMGDTQVLPRRVIELLGAPHASVPGGDSHYGYGLMVDQVGGVRILSHGGARAGYGSTIMMAPERKFAAIVLANRSMTTMGQVADKAMEVVLGLKEPEAVKPATIAMTAAEAQLYAGRFTDSEQTIEVLANGAGLTVKSPDGDGPAVKVGDGRFRMTGGPGMEFLLLKDKAGRYAYLYTDLHVFRRL